MNSAFAAYDLAGLDLPNRLVMAPMTRTRAPRSVPDALVAEYYAQRASAGLIITEGTAPSEIGLGYPDTPGIYAASQIAGWRQVTDAVHGAGGRIFIQLMHVGRIGDPRLHPSGANLVAPSAVTAEGRVYTRHGLAGYVTPDALTPDGIRTAISDYATAARNAVDAGFDGVEIHGANGYLIHQFLSSNVNLRRDEWGGDVAGRIRFAVEVVSAVAAAIGPSRVGLRISPTNRLHDIEETESHELYLALLAAIAPIGIAYLHVSEWADIRPLTADLRTAWPATLILNPWTGGRPTDAQELALVEGDRPVADLLALGANFIGNPDLPERLRHGLPLNELRGGLFYGVGPEGYTDYPTAAADRTA